MAEAGRALDRLARSIAKNIAKEMVEKKEQKERERRKKARDDRLLAIEIGKRLLRHCRKTGEDPMAVALGLTGAEAAETCENRG